MAFFQNRGRGDGLLVGVDATLALGDLEKDDDHAIRSTTEGAAEAEGFARARISRRAGSPLSSLGLAGRRPAELSVALTDLDDATARLEPDALARLESDARAISNPIPTGKTLAPAPIVTLNHPGAASNPPPSISPRRVHTASGVVVKSPRFYSAYTGPKLAELNAVKASAKLLANGDFRFTGTNQGRITRRRPFMSGGSTATATCPPARSRGVRTSSSTRS